MTGTKNPTEQLKAAEIKEEVVKKDMIIKKHFADFQNNYVETCLEFSKDVIESLRLLLQELKVRFEQFRDKPESILDIFSNLQKWTKGEQ